MHFEITASMTAIRKNLTKAQRNSSLFAEAPRVAGQTLRRGVAVRLTREQFETQQVMLKRLYDAGAIEIAQVDGDRRRDMRSEEEKMELKKPEPKEVEKKEEAPPVDTKPPAVITLPPPPPEPAATPATAMEDAGFVSPEKLVAAVDAENKQTEEQIEKAVATLAPSEEPTPAVPTPAPSRPSQPEKASSKKGRK